MSNPYDDHAAAFMAARSGIGGPEVERWARAHLRPGQRVLDLGCGHGFPVTWVLLRNDLDVFAIDNSPMLIAELQRRSPNVTAQCEDVFESNLFARSFDAVTMIGLVFLFGPKLQERLIRRAASVLRPGGRLLFTAPTQVHAWDDVLTGQPLQSLGYTRYKAIIEASGLRIAGSFRDTGGNHYYDTVDARRLAS